MPTDTPFLPFSTHLDRDTALRTLQAAVAGADDGELFLERRRAEVLAFDDGRLKTASYDAAEGFGLWSFVSKFTLAFAAVTLLPALQNAGFDSASASNPPQALALRTILYAAVPCGLKVVAIALLATTNLKET